MEHHILQGDLSIADLLSAMGLNNLDRIGKKVDWLIDLRQAKLCASPDELRKLGAQIKELREKNLSDGICRMVALAEDDVTFGLLRIFIVYAESTNCRLHVCRCEGEAQSFLSAECA